MKPYIPSLPTTLRPPTAPTTALLLLALSALASAPTSAKEFISQQGIPDAVLSKNIERLVDFVITNKLDSGSSGVSVTRILGKEDLGFSKARVWFCLRRPQNGQPVDSCGNEIRLIRLDSGRWILQDEQRDNWIVVQE